MKIISLRFANLNSLPGPYHIRFDQAPLADTGLFAITGPTGAGKSTLLDAIAVGLYGRVPRHDREVREMVSRHADEAWAEVEFEVRPPATEAHAPDRVRYRSRWQIARKTRGKDKGGLNQDVMTLVLCATGEALASGKANVPDKVSELSGLDFRQFEQAILLSQGNFARFLHAPEPERSALLEKMTNVGIYSRLSVAAFEKARAEEQATRLLEASLNATRLLPPEERQALEQQLAGLEEETQLMWEHVNERGDQLAWRTHADHLDKRLVDNERDTATLREAAEQLRPEAERLAGHERAATLLLPLSLTAAARRELAQDAEALAQLHHELPALAQATDAATAARQQADHAQAEAEAETERLRPLLREAQRQDAHLAATERQLADQQATHDHQARELTAAHATHQALTDELAGLDQQQQELSAWLLAHNHEADPSDALKEINRDLHDLSEAARHLTRLETEQEQLLLQLDAATTARHGHQQAAVAAARHQQALREREQPIQAALAALLGERQSADLTRAATDLTQRQHLLERLLPLLQTARQQTTRAADLQAETEAADLAAQPATAALAQLAKDHAAAQLLLDSYEHALRLQQELADLNAHRHQLQPGAACPLCGATEHRYAPDYRAHADDQAQRVQQQKLVLRTIEADLREAELAAVRQRTEQQQRQLRQHEATQAAAAAQQQAAALATGHPDLPLEVAALEIALTETTAAHQQAVAACTHLAELEQQQQQLRTEYDLAREQAQLAAGLATEADHRVQLSQQELAGLKSDVAERRAAAANYRHVVQATLAPHQLSLPAAAPYDGVLATLAERAATFTEQQQARQATQDAHLGKQAEHRTRAAALLGREADLAATATALAAAQHELATARAARLAHYPGPDPAADEQALHQATQQLTQVARRAADEQAQHQQRLARHQERTAQRQADQHRHQTDFDQRQTELSAALAAAHFASADEAQRLLLPPAEVERLAARQQQHATRQQATAQLHQQLSAELTHHYELALTTLPTATLQAELKQLNAENDQLQQRYGGVARLLEYDDQTRQRQADGLRELTLRQQEQQRWHDLAEQIGSATGAKFSQFAQGLTLAHLARLANLRLRQLTTRYTILKTPDQNLELRIIDHDQADTVRPMASLSGGESFLVSLALALGLSELAGYQARIESLFIDEGFGSLDPESLNMALDALERLQHSGKMIGVISHVADLKERIATQIRVQPTSGGNSTVRVVGLTGEEVDCGA